ncbi:MAG TPA: hypothetical protein DDW71_06330 [Lactobacillus sp.]|nr:hypothetical protein [Lactobacillus sp.]
MSADWVQAIGVLVSFAIAGLGYIQARRSAARTALRRILNLADEFTLIIDDDARYKYFELSTDHQSIDFNIWVNEVENFNSEFRDDLNALWEALDNLRFLPWFKDKYSATLNSGNLVRKTLERMLFILQTKKIKSVQHQKEFTAKALLTFSNDLCDLASNTKLIPSNNLKNSYESLQCYVKNGEVIASAISKFRFCDECHLQFLDNGSPWFYLSAMYTQKLRDSKEQSGSTYSWKTLRGKIKTSEVDKSLKSLFRPNKPVSEDDLAMDIIRTVAKREALKYKEKAKFELIKEDATNKYQVVLKTIDYKFKKQRIKTFFRSLNTNKDFRSAYKFSKLRYYFHPRYYTM